MNQVKEFINKFEIIRNKKIIILMNNEDNRFIFKDIIYILENLDQILSLMKLHHKKQINFYLS